MNNDVKLQDVPIVGNKHSFFDDGKQSISRHHIAEVVNIVTKENAKELFLNIKDYNNNIYPKSLYDIWVDEVNNHRQSAYGMVLCRNMKEGEPWLYDEDTDYFIECLIPSYDENSVWFVRDINGGWFSINTINSWMSGRLMPLNFDFETFCESLD